MAQEILKGRGASWPNSLPDGQEKLIIDFL